MTEKQKRLVSSIQSELNKQLGRLEDVLLEIKERDDEATGERPSLSYDYTVANSLESAMRSVTEGIGELKECVEEYADR